MRTSTLLRITLAGACVAAAALAGTRTLRAESRTGPGGRGGGPGRRMAERLRQLDTDHDGALAFDELSRGEHFARLDRDADGRVLRTDVPQRDEALRRFDRADANHDGTLTKHEAEAAGRERFDEADADRDGRLTPDEMRAAFEARRQERAEVRLRELDGDGDGSVSVDEFLAHPGRLGRLDADGDGAVERDEAPEGERAQRVFDRADGDGDGRISESEAQAVRRRAFERLDRDGDGRLSSDELGMRAPGGPRGRGRLG